MSYFEEKIERLETKHVHFQAYLEPVSEFTRERNDVNPIGTYSGINRGDTAAQADYAHGKIKLWDVIFNFVDQFPITKVSTNPIIQRAIEAEAQKRVDAFKRIGSIIDVTTMNTLPVDGSGDFKKARVTALITPIASSLDPIAQQNPVLNLNDIIADQYSLKHHSEAQLKKWRTRIGQRQKINMLSDLLRSINVTPNEIEEGQGNHLALGWKSDQK